MVDEIDTRYLLPGLAWVPRTIVSAILRYAVCCVRALAVLMLVLPRGMYNGCMCRLCLRGPVPFLYCTVLSPCSAFPRYIPMS